MSKTGDDSIFAGQASEAVHTYGPIIAVTSLTWDYGLRRTLSPLQYSLFIFHRVVSLVIQSLG